MTRAGGAQDPIDDVHARHEAERQRLLSIIEQSADAIVTKDAAGIITDWNHGAQKLYGYREDEAIGQSISLIMPPDRPDEGHELLASALAGATTTSLETVRLRKDGTSVDVSLTVSPLRDERGVPIGAAVIARDISASKAMERQLTGLFEHIPAGLAIRDLDGRYLRVNSALAGIYERTPATMTGLNPADLHPDPPTRVRSRDEDLEILTTGKPVVGPYTLTGSDGITRHFHTIRYPILDASGQVNGFGSFALDVSEQRRVERENHENAELLRNTLENAPIGMAVSDLTGSWQRVNHAFCEIVGYTETELLGLSFQELTHPEDLGPDVTALSELLAGEIPDIRIEKRYLHKSGEIVWVQVSVTLVRDANGAPLYFIAQIQDITGERAARLALAETERRFRSIADNVPGMVYRFVQHPDGTASLPFVSAAARDIYELEPEEAMEDPDVILSRVHPDDEARVHESIAASAATMSRWELQCRHVMDDGRIKHIRAMAQPVREPDGSVAWDGVIVDETELFEAQFQESHSRQRLQSILENLAGSAVTIYDREQRLLMCEGPLFAHVDLTDLIGKRLSDITTADSVEMLSPALELALSGEPSALVIDRDNQGRTLAVRMAPYRMADGSIEGALVHWHDITSVRQAERARDEAQDRFRVAFERAPIGMAIVSEDGRLERVNQAYCDLTGYSAEELLELEPFSSVHPEDAGAAQSLFATLGAGQDTVTLESRLAHASGHYRWVQARVTLIRNADGTPLHALAQMLDITDRRAYEQRLKHLADHDPLTGLRNRRAFESALTSQLTGEEHTAGALLLLDLDGFKQVNDTLGHAAGDDLLVRCARGMTGRLRQTDTVGRLGGDEFAILLPHETAEAAEHVAGALLETIRHATAGFITTGMSSVTASVGIAMFADGATSTEELLARADLAMYSAKAAGKDRYAMYASDRTDLPAADAQQSSGDRHSTAVS